MSAQPINLTLTGIQLDLIQLYQFRDEVMSDPDITPQEQAESLKAANAAIDDYVARELDKADAIAHNLGEFGIRAESCKAIAQKEKLRAAMWEARAAHLEEATLRALMLRPEGKRKIETASTTLKVAKNPASVQVIDASQLPKPYMRRSVTMNADLFDRLMGYLMTKDKDGGSLFVELQEAKTTDPEPMLTAIGKELKAKIDVPGARLVTDRVRLVVE